MPLSSVHAYKLFIPLTGMHREEGDGMIINLQWQRDQEEEEEQGKKKEKKSTVIKRGMKWIMNCNVCQECSV